MKSELLFLAGCECKGTTSFWNHQIFGKVFFSRASSELETPLRNSKATEERNPQSYLPYISPETVSDTSDQSDRQARSETPFFWVANAKVQQLFESTKYSEKFFFESLACASYTYYILGVPKSQCLIIMSYPPVSETSTKEATEQRSIHQNLLTTQGSSDTSEDPFFWVASAKVQRLFETTKFSANFFSPNVGLSALSLVVKVYITSCSTERQIEQRLHSAWLNI